MAQVRQVRQYIGYAQLAYWGLIVLIFLLIVGMILISRDVKKITRELGVNFLVYGLIGLVTLFASRYVLQQYTDPMVKSLSSFMPPH